jgi:hypothetical protein
VTAQRNGPPKRKGCRLGQPTPSPETPTNTNSVRQADRRRVAAKRLPPLDSGSRDPRCRDNPEPSERMVDGYRDAVRHLQANGLPPAPFLPEMRIMWRRGGDDRRLASAIARCWEVAA